MQGQKNLIHQDDTPFKFELTNTQGNNFKSRNEDDLTYSEAEEHIDESKPKNKVNFRVKKKLNIKSKWKNNE